MRYSKHQQQVASERAGKDPVRVRQDSDAANREVGDLRNSRSPAGEYERRKEDAAEPEHEIHRLTEVVREELLRPYENAGEQQINEQGLE